MRIGVALLHQTKWVFYQIVFSPTSRLDGACDEDTPKPAQKKWDLLIFDEIPPLFFDEIIWSVIKKSESLWQVASMASQKSSLTGTQQDLARTHDGGAWIFCPSCHHPESRVIPESENEVESVDYIFSSVAKNRSSHVGKKQMSLIDVIISSGRKAIEKDTGMTDFLIP
jgi:hypothetical protein